MFLLHLCESTFLYVWQQQSFSHRLQVSTVMASIGKDAFYLSIVMQTSVFLVVTASLKFEFKVAMPVQRTHRRPDGVVVNMLFSILGCCSHTQSAAAHSPTHINNPGPSQIFKPARRDCRWRAGVSITPAAAPQTVPPQQRDFRSICVTL